ncbi:MAG: ATP-binding protein, partial [Pseudomonadota bacterium]|nr:ATP-binding protein [Pseudomonadota bacterium]
RAQSGVNRLSTILNSMSEATRLEQAIQQEDLEPFDLVKVISGCIAGYEHAYSHRRFSFTHNADTARILGSPELTAQMFDKVIANAVDFSEKESEIQVSITVKDKQAELTISNTGPLLPEGMRSQLLQSMVSVRKENDVQNASSPHLGLGLYIANIIMTFHKGQLSLFNRKDSTGVVVSARFPLM